MNIEIESMVSLFEAAVESERDAALCDFMGQDGKNDREATAKLLYAVRAHREKFRGLED